MAAIDWDDVVALAPSVSGVAVAGQTAILAYVNDDSTFKDVDWRGEDSDMLHLGRCYLAAHFGTLVTQGSAGPVTSRKVGGVSESFAAMSSAGGLASTGYGQMFQWLARSASGGPVLL
jgi:hypothetical protein